MGPKSVAPDEIPYTYQYIYCIVACVKETKQHRCFGYYTSRYTAINALTSMWKDIEECMYDSFFIERFREGLHTTGEVIEYFEIDDTARDLIKKEVPQGIKCNINWALG